MLSKNTAVILPSLNSPRKIKGTYALLNKRLGKKAAADLLLKNPGVLVCSPEGLSKSSDEEIIKAADFAASQVANVAARTRHGTITGHSQEALGTPRRVSGGLRAISAH